MNSYLEVFLRTTFSFIVLFASAKMLGKQLISRMTLFDYIAGIVMGTLAAEVAVNLNSDIRIPLMGLTLWSLYSFGLALVALKSRKIRKFVEGEPTLLIQNGKILDKNMKKNHFNIDELLMGLRQKNIFNIADVEFALLEPDGQISILPKSQKRPINPSDLKISTSYEGLSSELIVDGEIVHQNLEQNKLDMEWLKEQLTAQQVETIQEVVLAQLDSSGSLYIDKRSESFPIMNKITDKE